MLKVFKHFVFFPILWYFLVGEKYVGEESLRKQNAKKKNAPHSRI